MSKLEKLKAAVRASEMDALLLTRGANRRYATGFESGDAGMLVVTAEQAFFFVDSRYIEAAEKELQDAQVEMVDRDRNYVSKINAVIERCGVRTIGVEDDQLSYAEYIKFQSELGAELVSASELMRQQRMVKDEDEIEKLIHAQRIAEKAFDEVLGIIRPGMTEKELAAELVYRMLRGGAENVSFDPIVVTGEKTSLPHGIPGDVEIRAGSFVTMDFGCKYAGYCSDMTRTVAVGQITEEMKTVYETVLRAQLAGIEAARGGVPGNEIDGAARSVIAAAGYGDYFGHSFGHGVGLDVHEAPNAAPNWTKPLPTGAVISAEPGIYLPGKFGVRIEDVLILRDDGCEDITRSPKQLIVL